LKQGTTTQSNKLTYKLGARQIKLRRQWHEEEKAKRKKKEKMKERKKTKKTTNVSPNWFG
jgi:adenylate kinase family enzyme